MEPSHYELLKSNVLKMAQERNIDMDFIKENFQSEISSRRALDEVTTLNELLELLEERDMLHENCVNCLEKLASLLDHSGIHSLLSSYKKLYGDENCCCVTSGNEVHTNTLVKTPFEPVLTPDAQPFTSRQYGSYIQNSIQSELDIAIQNVSKNIGSKWRVLARELDLTEKQIEDIFRGCQDSESQALKVFQLWKKSNSNNVDTNALKDALNSRLCQNEGIGSHMLNHYYSVY